MSIPKLKRIKVPSQRALRTWLAKNAGPEQEVMIVTCNTASRDKSISSAGVRLAVQERGWTAGRSYSLVGNLNGHAIRYVPAQSR